MKNVKILITEKLAKQKNIGTKKENEKVMELQVQLDNFNFALRKEDSEVLNVA